MLWMMLFLLTSLYFYLPVCMCVSWSIVSSSYAWLTLLLELPCFAVWIVLSRSLNYFQPKVQLADQNLNLGSLTKHFWSLLKLRIQIWIRFAFPIQNTICVWVLMWTWMRDVGLKASLSSLMIALFESLRHFIFKTSFIECDTSTEQDSWAPLWWE